MWEDESLHVQMRNIEISEAGVFNLQKEAQFLHRYRVSTEGALLPGMKPERVSESVIVRQAVLLL